MTGPISVGLGKGMDGPGAENESVCTSVVFAGATTSDCAVFISDSLLAAIAAFTAAVTTSELTLRPAVLPVFNEAFTAASTAAFRTFEFT